MTGSAARCSWSGAMRRVSAFGSRPRSQTMGTIVSSTAHSKSPLWQEQCILWCAHESSGSQPVQNKLRTKGKDVKIQERKILSEKTGCRCKLTIKFFQHTDAILERYDDAHNHPLGFQTLYQSRRSVLAPRSAIAFCAQTYT